MGIWYKERATNSQNISGKAPTRPSKAPSTGKTARSARRGQSVIELALILPLIVLMLAGVVDLGRGVHAYVTITNAAREGARHASAVPNDRIGIEARVQNELNGTEIAVTSVDIEFPNGGNTTPGNPVLVRVNYTFTTIVGSIFGSSQINVSSSVQMMILDEEE